MAKKPNRENEDVRASFHDRFDSTQFHNNFGSGRRGRRIGAYTLSMSMASKPTR